MKILGIEGYLDYLYFSEPKWFLEISHINGLTSYEIINIRNPYSRSIFKTFVKDELKIWMDLNGLKLSGKKIIVGSVYDKLDIDFESFELKKD